MENTYQAFINELSSEGADFFMSEEKNNLPVKYYGTVAGHIGDYYYDVNFFQHENGYQEVRIAHTTECKRYIFNMLKKIVNGVQIIITKG